MDAFYVKLTAPRGKSYNPLSSTRMSQETEESAQAQRSAWGIALGAGSEFVAYALIGFFAGSWLDEKFHSAPWCAQVMSVGAITLGQNQNDRTIIPRKNGPQGRR